MSRKYLIIPVSEVSKVDFSQVCETSEATLRKSVDETKTFIKSKKVKAASKKEIQSTINLCIKNLEKINFFKPKEKKPIMLQNLRNIFYRMDLSDKETRILSSVFASLGKKR